MGKGDIQYWLIGSTHREKREREERETEYIFRERSENHNILLLLPSLPHSFYFIFSQEKKKESWERARGRAEVCNYGVRSLSILSVSTFTTFIEAFFRCLVLEYTNTYMRIWWVVGARACIGGVDFMASCGNPRSQLKALYTASGGNGVCLSFILSKKGWNFAGEKNWDSGFWSSCLLLLFSYWGLSSRYWDLKRVRK